MRLISVLATVLDTEYDGQKPRMAFIAATGIGGPIVDRMRQLGHRNVVEVQFGGKPPDAHYANMRAWMWAELKDWLTRGSIDADARRRWT